MATSSIGERLATGGGLKVPPHSQEAEQAVLGGLMLDPEAWVTVSERLAAEDFYRADHRLIFEAIGALVDEAKPCDVVTVAEWLERHERLDQAGGLAYLASLVENTPSAANIATYADIVRERAVLRHLIRAGTEVADAGYNPQGRSSDELVELAEQRVFEIADRNRRGRAGARPIKDLLVGTLERIDQLYQQDSPITGVATGYTQFDDMTSGLQPGDLIIVAGRPSMGKCIVEGSRVLDPGTGRLVTIEQRVRERRADVVSLDAQGRLVAARASAFVDDGRKPVWRVRTALGRELLATAPHPFLTIEGWKRLEILRVGEHIAVPRRLPFFGSESMRDSEVTLIAYLLTDGALTGSVPRFTNSNARLRRDFIAAVRDAFPDLRCRVSDSNGMRTPTVHVVRGHRSVVDRRTAFARRLREAMKALGRSGRELAAVAGVSPAALCRWTHGTSMPGPTALARPGPCIGLDAGEVAAAERAQWNAPNPMTLWLKALGLWGLRAPEKRVPERVFSLPREQLALFLNRAFACDGAAHVHNGNQAVLSYASSSEALARDMQHLLLRFGIVATLRRRRLRYRGERRTSWELRVTRQEDIETFAREIGIHGKEQALRRVLDASRGKRRKVNRDVVPAGVWALIDRARKGEVTWAELARRIGRGGRGSNLDVGSRGLSRPRLEEIGRALGDESLVNLARADVYWDRIEAIEYAGWRRVYDLTVPGHHNFVAEDVIVHNTAFAVNIAEHAAIKDKLSVAIFSMEMPGEQLAMRMMSSLGRIDQHRVRTGRLNDDDWPRLTSAVSLLSEARMFIDDTPALTPSELRARCRRIAREHGLDLVLVDYLQLMQVPGTTENRATEISEISRGLKALAKELKVPVIALSQLNRSLESRTDKRPVMSDLRESGAIEQDADVIVFIYRDEVYDEDSADKGIAEIIIGKQRNGPIGKVRLAFLGQYTRFENLAPEDYVP